MINFISRVFVISLLFSFVYAQDASGIKKGADNDAKKPNTSKVSKEKGSGGGKLTPSGNSSRMSNTAAPAPKKRRASGGKSKKSGKVSANIPGKVVTVEVSVGDEVTEGQVVMILEAMKMQNEIQAPIAGTVTEVHCEEGQSIEANIPLLVITPPPSEDAD